MSKYTTTVKDICESIFFQEVGHPDIIDKLSRYVDDIITNDTVHEKIFGNNTWSPYFNSVYIKTIENKILLKYYTREICEETFGLWRLRVKSKINEISPYYGQLYNETFEKYGISNPFIDTDYTDSLSRQLLRDFTRGTTERSTDNITDLSSGTESGTGSENYTNHEKTTYSGKYKDSEIKKYSDTPQGNTSSITTGYLTNITETNNEHDGNNYTEERTLPNSENTSNISTTKSTEQNKEHNREHNDTQNSTENAQSTHIVVGKRGIMSYAKLLKELRETIINIDNDIINEFSDLFFLLWE